MSIELFISLVSILLALSTGVLGWFQWRSTSKVSHADAT